LAQQQGQQRQELCSMTRRWQQPLAMRQQQDPASGILQQQGQQQQQICSRTCRWQHSLQMCVQHTAASRYLQQRGMLLLHRRTGTM
jgi:hypothetical protein